MKSEKGIAREARRQVGTCADTYRVDSREVAERLVQGRLVADGYLGCHSRATCLLAERSNDKLSVRDLASILGVSRRTVRRALSYARAEWRVERETES